MTPGTVLVDVFGPLINIERLFPFDSIENARPMQAKELAFALNEKQIEPYGSEWTSSRVYELILKGLSDQTQLAKCLGAAERRAIETLLKKNLAVYAVTTIPNRKIQSLLKSFIKKQWDGKVRMVVRSHDPAAPALAFKAFQSWVNRLKTPVFAIVDSHWPFLPRARAMFRQRLRISTKIFPLAPTVADLGSAFKNPNVDATGPTPDMLLSWPNNLTTEEAKKRNLESYKQCFCQALRRMAVVLNSSRFYKLCGYSWLHHSDSFITYVFQQAKLDDALFELNFEPLNERRSLKEVATHYFYGIWKFDPRRRGALREYSCFVIEHKVRGAFFVWGHESLFLPKGPDEELRRGRFADGSCFVSECASTHLLRNFWHNFAHNYIQAITDENYTCFGGEPRYDSDLEADNLANILLVYSYGFPILTDGGMRPGHQLGIMGLFKRSACNNIFQKRALIRNHEMKISNDREALEEYEWLFRRRVGRYVSQALLAEGFAVRDVKVMLTGSEWKRERGSKLYWRKNSKVVVVLNGLRVHTDVTLMMLAKRVKAIKENRIPDDTTEKEVRKLMLETSQNVAAVAVNAYREFFRNRGVKEFARSSLAALMERFGINLAASQELQKI
jgi:hypothetical protein